MMMIVTLHVPRVSCTGTGSPYSTIGRESRRRTGRHSYVYDLQL